jgi:hypothetical protein
MHEYNTQRAHLILKEYGRNIQKIVDYLRTIEDDSKRSKLAKTLVELMRQLSPSFSKDANEQYNKLWDDLFIMSGFELKVESPFPVPPREILEKKPEKVNYNYNNLKYKHYGRNIELLIQKAVSMEQSSEKDAFVTYIAKQMKAFYVLWNKEVVDDIVILDQLREMSNGKLILDVSKVKEEGILDNRQPYRGRRPTTNTSRIASNANANASASSTSSSTRIDQRRRPRN